MNLLECWNLKHKAICLERIKGGSESYKLHTANISLKQTTLQYDRQDIQNIEQRGSVEFKRHN